MLEKKCDLKMPSVIDLTGHKYGRLTVLNRVGSKYGHSLWNCRCDCGNQKIFISSDLRSNKVSSCGCYRHEINVGNTFSRLGGIVRGLQLLKHGECNTRLYKIWKSMHQRCNNPKNRFYLNYGGRGIKACSEWDDYINFWDWAMSNGYNPIARFGECTIDRIDNNQGYCPDNCRWVGLQTQANNRRKRRIYK